MNPPFNSGVLTADRSLADPVSPMETSPVTVPTEGKPVFVDSHGRRRIWVRIGATATAILGVAFIAGVGLLLGNTPMGIVPWLENSTEPVPPISAHSALPPPAITRGTPGFGVVVKPGGVELPEAQSQPLLTLLDTLMDPAPQPAVVTSPVQKPSGQATGQPVMSLQSGSPSSATSSASATTTTNPAPPVTPPTTTTPPTSAAKPPPTTTTPPTSTTTPPSAITPPTSTAKPAPTRHHRHGGTTTTTASPPTTTTKPPAGTTAGSGSVAS